MPATHSLKEKPSQVVSKLNFCHLFHSAWLDAVTPHGFKKAGIWLFNPDAVQVASEWTQRMWSNRGDFRILAEGFPTQVPPQLLKGIYRGVCGNLMRVFLQGWIQP